MKSRLIAGASAIVLAAIGALLVFSYAGNADDRALANLEPTQVLIVQKPVPAGTPAENMGEYLAVESLPGKAVVSTALADLESSAGKVAATDLVQGEQLLAERLIAPEDIETPSTVEVPAGLQEISLQLEPQRVVGGRIAAGDRVGVFISIQEGALKDSPGPTTQLVFHKTLVTAVQRAPQPLTEEGKADSQSLPEGSLLLTMAVDDRAAQKMIFAAEFGTIWLSKEPAKAKENKLEILQKTEVYR